MKTADAQSQDKYGTQIGDVKSTFGPVQF